jgi:hypothetical protein
LEAIILVALIETKPTVFQNLMGKIHTRSSKKLLALILRQTTQSVNLTVIFKEKNTRFAEHGRCTRELRDMHGKL